MNKKYKIVISALVIVTILGVLSSTLLGNSKKIRGSEAIEKEKTNSIAVSVNPVEIGSISNEIFTIGKIIPAATYKANSKSSGEVMDIFYKVGDLVKKDDILFTINSEGYSADKSSKLSQSSNQVTQARDALKLSEKKYNDEKILYASGASSKTNLDNSKTNYNNSLIAYENALSNLNSIKVSYSKQDDHYMIKSPVDGIITESSVKKGMFANTQNGMTIIVNDKLLVESSIPSKYINEIKEGQAVDIYVNSIEKNYKGKVNSISYLGTKGSFPLEIIIENNDKSIYSGMYAEMKINTATNENSKIASINSIIKENNKTYVFLAKDNIAKKVEVKLGIKNKDHVEISGNIKENDNLVTLGKEYIEDGNRLNIK